MGPRLGILAGSGPLPRRLAELCRNDGRDVVVVGFSGQTDPRTVDGFPHIWAGLGEAGRVIRFLKDQDVVELVFFGPIRRPSLTDLKPDWHAAAFLAKVGRRAFGDDGLLSAVARTLEEDEGFRVVPVQTLWDSLLLPAGRLGSHGPDATADADIVRGSSVIRALGAVDVGQAAVVQHGLVLGVEAIEGTDALLDRCGALRRPGPGGVLVKLPKPSQDHRLDLPTIGPDTVTRAASAGLVGIAAAARATLAVDQPRIRELADAAGLFVIGLELSTYGT